MTEGATVFNSPYSLHVQGMTMRSTFMKNKKGNTLISNRDHAITVALEQSVSEFPKGIMILEGDRNTIR